MDRERLRQAFVNFAGAGKSQEIVEGLADEALTSGSQIAKDLADRVVDEAGS